MYEARHADLSPVSLVSEPDAAVAAALRSGPRRASVSKWSAVSGKVAPASLSLALAATAGALVLNSRSVATEEVTAVPARDDVTSRANELRTELKRLASDSPTAQAASAVPVAAQWSSTFGTVAETKYAQQALSVRGQANGDAAAIAELASGAEVKVTNITSGPWRQAVVDKKLGWVLDSQLGNKAPAKVVAGQAPTTYNGPSVLGLKPKAMVVYSAVTSAFRVPSVGGWRSSSRSSHQCGLAIDFMVYSNGGLGDQVADYVMANAAAWGVTHMIWKQRIWTPRQPQWRAMANRGSATANHMDHVHVALADHC